MMSLLFALFLLVMVLALKQKGKFSFFVFAAAIVLSTGWFLHHASSTLSIQL